MGVVTLVPVLPIETFVDVVDFSPTNGTNINETQSHTRVLPLSLSTQDYMYVHSLLLIEKKHLLQYDINIEAILIKS